RGGWGRGRGGGMRGRVVKTRGRPRPPPAGVRPPSLWGTEARIAEMFGKQADDIRIERRNFVFRYLSTQHWLEVFKTYYGPMLKAFGALEAPAQAALAKDLLDLARDHNRSGDDTMVAPSEYLEIVITRR